MKTVKIKALELNNRGDLLLAQSNGQYFVKTTDGVMTYNLEEMAELFNFEDWTTAILSSSQGCDHFRTKAGGRYELQHITWEPDGVKVYAFGDSLPFPMSEINYFYS